MCIVTFSFSHQPDAAALIANDPWRARILAQKKSLNRP